MSTWREQAAHAATALITAAGTAAMVYSTDIRAKADYIKSHSTDTSSVEASAIARKISDEIKQRRPGISISGSV